MTMIQIYKDGESKRIPALDFTQAVRDQGWTTEPQPEKPGNAQLKENVPEPTTANLGETLDVEVDKALPKGTSQSKHKADK